MNKSVIGSFVMLTALLATPASAEGMSDMKGMAMDAAAAQGEATHVARGVVKKIDRGLAKVTLAHEPVASLQWPKMTMGFLVRDKASLERLAEGAQVEVDFVREGKDYVITSVR